MLFSNTILLPFLGTASLVLGGVTNPAPVSQPTQPHEASVCPPDRFHLHAGEGYVKLSIGDPQQVKQTREANGHGHFQVYCLNPQGQWAIRRGNRACDVFHAEKLNLPGCHYALKGSQGYCGPHLITGRWDCKLRTPYAFTPGEHLAIDGFRHRKQVTLWAREPAKLIRAEDLYLKQTGAKDVRLVLEWDDYVFHHKDN